VTSSGTPSADQIAVAQFIVEGTHCGSCVSLIEETLVERNGVKAAFVDLDSARAVVQYDPSALGGDDIRVAIDEAGYSATPVN
jgi:copper chaperone CopZ